MVVRCSSGVQCSVGQGWCWCCSLLLLRSFTQIHTQRIASSCIFFFARVVCVFTGSWTFDLNRELEGQRQDPMVECSLVDVAAHYAERQGVLICYCGQWSIKSRPNMNWKGESNPFFSQPHAAHIFLHIPTPTPASQFCDSLCPLWSCLTLAMPPWALAPSMWLARLSSCRGSAVVSAALKGCLSEEEGKARAPPRYGDITSLEESGCRGRSATVVFPISIRGAL